MDSNKLRSILSFDIGAAKVTTLEDKKIRWLITKNRGKVLQVAVHWTMGTKGGFDWVDVQEVKEE